MFKLQFSEERPERYESTKPEIQKVLQILAEQLRQALPVGAFGDRERAVLTLANELVRGVLEQDLQDIADSFGDFVEYRGQTYRRHELVNAKYPSLCGPIEVARHSYRLVGVRNGQTIIPLELEAGFIAGASWTTLERLAKRLAASVVAETLRIEPKVRRLERVPTQGTGATARRHRGR